MDNIITNQLITHDSLNAVYWVLKDILLVLSGILVLVAVIALHRILKGR